MFKIPVYIYECTKCGTVGEFITKMDEMQKCPHCGAEMIRPPQAPNINIGVPHGGYYDEDLETYITSNKHKREVMRQKGVTPHGDTPKPDGDAWV